MVRRLSVLLLLPALATAAAPPGPRGVDRHGDPLPPGAAARLGTVRLRHAMSWGGASFAFSADGKTLLSFAVSLPALLNPPETQLRLWDTRTGVPLDCPVETEGLRHVHLLPGGNTLLSVKVVAGPGLSDHVWTIQRWTWPAGAPLGEVELPPEDQVVHTEKAQLSPDGKVLVRWHDRADPTVWDAQSGKFRFRLHLPGQEVRTLAFTPDTGRLVLVSKSGLHLFDTASGKRIRERIFEPGGFGPFGWFIAPEVSPDGRLLAVSAANGLLLVEVPSLRLLLRRTDLTGPACFSPDGAWLACSAKQALNLLDARRLRTVRVFEPHHEPTVSALRFFPDGRRLVLGGEHTISLWDVATGKRLPAPAGHRSAVRSLAFSPDGRHLASGGEDGLASVWDVPAGRLRHAFAGHHDCAAGLAFSPDGRLLATGDGSTSRVNCREAQVRLFDLGTGRLLRQFPAHYGGAHTLRFSPDGKSLATAGWDDRVRLWEVSSARRLGQCRHLLRPQPVAFLGGKSLLVHHEDGTWRVVDPASFRAVHCFSGSLVTGSTAPIHQGGAGEVAAVQGAKVVWYRLSDGKQVRATPVEGTSSFSSTTLSADGRILAASQQGRYSEVDLWDLTSGQAIARLRGHTDIVSAVAFSPDGRWLATGGRDTAVLLWDVAWLRLEHALAELLAGRGDVGALADFPGRAVAGLEARLRQAARSEVRARRMIRDLDDDRLAVREKATRELEGLGAEAGFALRQALQARPSPEVRVRARRVLGRIEKAGARPLDPRSVRRGVELLWKLDTAAARQVLQELAGLGAETLVGQEARRLMTEGRR